MKRKKDNPDGLNKMPDRKKNSLVLLLYLAVMLTSVFHRHGMEENWFAHPVFIENHHNGITHHSSVIASECLLLLFAGNPALTESKFSTGHFQKLSLSVKNGQREEVSSQKFNISPLRGPPAI